jgi:hypothetical protein
LGRQQQQQLRLQRRRQTDCFFVGRTKQQLHHLRLVDSA